MTTLKVDVTPEDIDHGEVASCTACPIARALFRATGGGQVHAGPALVGWWTGNVKHQYKTPPTASAFMSAFDNGDFVLPFSFELEIP